MPVMWVAVAWLLTLVAFAAGLWAERRYDRRHPRQTEPARRVGTWAGDGR